MMWCNNAASTTHIIEHNCLPRVCTREEVSAPTVTTSIAARLWFTLSKQTIQISKSSIEVLLRDEHPRMRHS